MRVLIVENEIYLAQSISAKLSEIGFQCELAAGIKDALSDKNYDVILLSTNINGQDFYPVLNAFKDKIVILLVTHLTHDTVAEPLQKGANDYIIKPFIMDELIRKINHLIEHEHLKKENLAYKAYIAHSFKGLQIDNISIKEPLPLFIKTNYQKYADAYAFSFANLLQEPFKFYSLTEKGIFNKIKNEKDTQLLYISDFQTLKKSEKQQFFDIIKDKRAIVSTTESAEEEIPFKTIFLKSDNKIFDRNDILTIDEYVKYIIINYQNKFPDTMLSKKLGISRKSLWEKRKKYEIFKKK
ncbi:MULTISPECIES: response regulator [Nitratiruptor]|uniref:Response regulator containing CheY-like receiver, AAA-type ATPase, and DNA-binding domains n=1 Tax=Nitratiruptor tergarcus DSM 16512 TaxID=1069081 RepID=A0A1W1WT79_9BACT|nr:MULTISPECIES: response regulator [Nitratiruptor]BCD61833.1 sulfate adenylyltransferase [Nitratiruptor sp. YY08-13]BCD65768.1 sulfate adenylyltransferase [Nitratiruptor sp. YY08-26]SMC09260.1 Response regulator containing CheY-like receiver, AAA-type ATPase, and DNA-binding domains [Nitratiruptor tergarcus DSM 16512]